ncbi:hypothetical protein L7F22_033811 [Adiantum nelumboides]|nr:hypothetical protein [Adiantum nelumboides]
MGRILPVEKQVIALLRLASGARMIDISDHFGVGNATVSKVIRKFVNALLEYRAHFIFWPRDPLHMEEVKRGFFLQHGLPNCCGALDITHDVNMEKPKCDSGVDWFDWNKNYSMSVQCIVDMSLRFMDVFAGWPGSPNDKRILRNSSFAQCVEQGFYLNGRSFHNQNLAIHEYVVADGGYTPSDWLMTPYVVPQTNRETRFNFKLSSTRIVVERAFGRLKNQWRFLNGKVACPRPKELSKIIVTCCTLHNMLLDMEEGIERDIVESSSFPRQPSRVPRLNARTLRNSLARYVCE